MHGATIKIKKKKNKVVNLKLSGIRLLTVDALGDVGEL